MKILVFLPNKPFLGHQISIVPMLEILKRNKGVDILCVSPNDKSSFFLKKLDLLDEASYINYKGYSWKGVFDKIKRFNPDQIYNLRPSSVKIDLYLILLKASIKKSIYRKGNYFLKYKPVTYNDKTYVGNNYVKLIDDKLNISEFYSEINNKKTDRVVIIPAGSNDIKLYSLGKYIEVANLLKEKGYTVEFLPGKGMDEDIEYLKNNASGFTIHLDNSLKDEQEIISNTSCVIATDCGPSHFAHIYNINRVCLFSRESAYFHEEWTGNDSNIKVLYGNTINDIKTIDITNSVITLTTNQ